MYEIHYIYYFSLFLFYFVTFFFLILILELNFSLKFCLLLFSLYFRKSNNRLIVYLFYTCYQYIISSSLIEIFRNQNRTKK